MASALCDLAGDRWRAHKWKDSIFLSQTRAPKRNVFQALFIKYHYL